MDYVFYLLSEFLCSKFSLKVVFEANDEKLNKKLIFLKKTIFSRINHKAKRSPTVLSEYSFIPLLLLLLFILFPIYVLVELQSSLP